MTTLDRPVGRSRYRTLKGASFSSEVFTISAPDRSGPISSTPREPEPPSGSRSHGTTPLSSCGGPSTIPRMVDRAGIRSGFSSAPSGISYTRTSGTAMVTGRCDVSGTSTGTAGPTCFSTRHTSTASTPPACFCHESTVSTVTRLYLMRSGLSVAQPAERASRLSRRLFETDRRDDRGVNAGADQASLWPFEVGFVRRRRDATAATPGRRERPVAGSGIAGAGDGLKLRIDPLVHDGHTFADRADGRNGDQRDKAGEEGILNEILTSLERHRAPKPVRHDVGVRR